jgi:hypothetical protein
MFIPAWDDNIGAALIGVWVQETRVSRSFCEMRETRTPTGRLLRAETVERQLRFPHLAKNERDMGHPLSCGTRRCSHSKGFANYLPLRQG